jgi:hypothetical protein
MRDADIESTRIGPTVSNQTDHELMTAVARGNLASMSEIYQNRHRALFRFFFRLTGRQASAEDLVHEVFLRMIRYRHTYQAGDGFEEAPPGNPGPRRHVRRRGAVRSREQSPVRVRRYG